jgi:hypothetical protein
MNCTTKILPLLLLILTAACAGNPAPSPLANSFAGGGGALSYAPAAAPAPDTAGEVGREIAALRGLPGDDQLRTLKWMLRVPDERRLAGLFEDLQGQPGESLNPHAVEARQRVEALIARLEAAGHRADDPEPDRDLAELDGNAQPPNYFPPTLIEELARHAKDPEAARALEEARKVSPRGVEPPR